MKVTMRPGQLPEFSFEADSPKEVFRRLATLYSLFSESKCGLCGSADIHYVERPVENGSYLELRCQNPDCRAQLSFGQNKDGKNIFKKTYDQDNKKALPHGGWYQYQKPAGGGKEKAPAQDTSSGEDIPF